MSLALRRLGSATRSPEALLLAMAAIGAFAFVLWMTLINNFAVERAGFDGWRMGVLQSVREIPGFLAFTAIYVILVVREQRFAAISLLLLALGVAITGLLPSFWGLIVTTTVMSIGFHYFETLHQSLALQWLDKDRAPLVLGRVVATRSAASLCAMAAIWIAFELLGLDFATVYLAGGGLALAACLLVWAIFPMFEQKVEQEKTIVLRKRYWLYYALVFLSGARRQIFVVFAGFLLVERYGYSVGDVTLLYILNALCNIAFAPAVGRLIGRFGERRALMIEYAGLIVVFLGYGLIDHAAAAAALYVADHLFFALAIAIKTYFQKIADPADFAPTAAVSFTISHIAAVFIPALYGLLWLWSPALVFVSGAAMAAISFALATLVPDRPEPGREIAPLAGKPSAPKPSVRAHG